MIKAAPPFLLRIVELKVVAFFFYKSLYHLAHLSPSSCSYPRHKKVSPRMIDPISFPTINYDFSASVRIYPVSQPPHKSHSEILELRVETTKINVAQNLFFAERRT